MCGRVTVTTPATELQRRFKLTRIVEALEKPRYNAAPTDLLPVVTNSGHRELDAFRWGLVPPGAPSLKEGARHINARAETVDRAPAYRQALRMRRCLVLVDGFFEWKKEPGSKVKRPFLLRARNQEPFALAGIWEQWNSAEHPEVIHTCSIITTTPNDLMATLHDRMPVVLSAEHYDLWLQPESVRTELLMPLLKPCPADWLSATEVSTRVNSVKNDVPECVEALR